MIKTTYVIGHRNPDTDSIASAIGYAALKQRLGDSTVIAAMAGAPNPQTRYILDRLEIPDPHFLADVHPKVRDTLKRRPVTVDRHASAYEALELFNKSGVRVLPVVDGDNRPCGILSLLRLSESYLLPCHDKIRQVTTTLPSLARTLAGRFETGSGDETPVTLNLFIGAMLEDSFNSRIDGYDPRELLIMTGNRRTIQQAAIERGVRVLVITGGHSLEEGLLEAAQKQGVTVLLTPHDTATAAWLARLSTPVACPCRTGICRDRCRQITCRPAPEADGDQHLCRTGAGGGRNPGRRRHQVVPAGAAPLPADSDGSQRTGAGGAGRRAG